MCNNTDYILFHLENLFFPKEAEFPDDVKIFVAAAN